jgi:plastocyanin
MFEMRPRQTRRAKLSRVRSVALLVIGASCGLVLPAGLAGAPPWAGGRAQAGEVRAVTIDNYSFTPGTLTIAAGTTVAWTNRDSEVHTVVADTPSDFKSAGLDTDDSFSFTFNKAGTYPYHCSLHPHMTGTIIVR